MEETSSNEDKETTKSNVPLDNRLVEVTNAPASQPALHRFLQYMPGSDHVDNKPKPEVKMLDTDVPTPDKCG